MRALQNPSALMQLQVYVIFHTEWSDWKSEPQKSGIHLGYKKRDYYEINSAALKFVYK